MTETAGGILLLDEVETEPKPKLIAQCTVCRPPAAVSIFWAMQFAKFQLSQNWPPNIDHVFNMAENKGGPGAIARTRNHLIARAFSESATRWEKVSDFAWQDDDVIPRSPKLWKCLYHHDKDIVNGVYFTRETYSQPLIFDGPSSGPAKFIPNQFRKCWGAGMGLTLVKADVYRRMALELDLGRDENGNPAWYKVTPPYVTEDLYFYDNAAKLGIEVWIDTGPDAFAFHHDLTTNKGYPEEQWTQFVSGQPISWESVTWPVN